MSRVSLLCDILNSTKRHKSMSCDLRVTARKVADAQECIARLDMRLHRSNESLNDSNRRNVDRTLVNFS